MSAPTRRAIALDALAVGASTGAYGISFGAIAVAGGLSAWQASVLSLAMFTGASQFAFVAVLGAGGAGMAAAATSVLLGLRNAFYGVRLSRVLDAGGRRRPLAAHLVIDESSAMSLAHDEDPAASRFAFWSTGAAVFVLWNLGTLIGSLGAAAVPDPEQLGLDMAAPAAFVALLAPRMRGRRPWAVALGAVLVALGVSPFVPAGIPILAAALYVLVAGLLLTRSQSRDGAGGSSGDGRGGRQDGSPMADGQVA